MSGYQCHEFGYLNVFSKDSFINYSKIWEYDPFPLPIVAGGQKFGLQCRPSFQGFNYK